MGRYSRSPEPTNVTVRNAIAIWGIETLPTIIQMSSSTGLFYVNDRQFRLIHEMEIVDGIDRCIDCGRFDCARVHDGAVRMGDAASA